MTDPVRIPFNKPYIAGRELYYVAKAVSLGDITGDGHFTQSCRKLLRERFSLHDVLLTNSCTSALEMAAMLCELEPGDEVIMPSFTFVSTASAVVRVQGTPVFVDIRADTFNIDETLIEEAITERTRGIAVVHYGGVGCEMETVLEIARRKNLFVVEDAAQGVNAYYDGKPLGSLGDVGCYSFHETKNYISGEGGALCINDEKLVQRAEILRDKGTNRRQFFQGVVDKYTWVDIGSSYVPSEIVSAFLLGQLEELDHLLEVRAVLYRKYREGLAPLLERGLIQQQAIPQICQSNYHTFALLVKDEQTRNSLLRHLNERKISAVFHYIPLHSSPMGRKVGKSAALPVTDSVSGRLVRLPLYYELEDEDITRVCKAVVEFFEL